MPAFPLLQTKFYVPRPPAGRIARPRLTHWLTDRSEERLILVSAPAGYGKTTLLAQWAGAVTFPVVWYQLDEADSDPAVFLSYLVEGLGRSLGQGEGAVPLGKAAKALLDSNDPTVTAAQVLAVLLNELSERLEGRWVLVLEDYHVITNPALHHLVDYLIANAPPGLQVVVAGRTDPPLALARLRARGLLAELRAPQLRFTEEEVRTWVRQVLPGMEDEVVRPLLEKTEGWPAALNIVLSSLPAREPAQVRRLIEGLSGTHRYIFDFLAEEVFRTLSPERQRFLLETSVLDRMDAAACQALTGVHDAQALLEGLERDNLFLLRLDEQGRWFRYHHLFREFLQARLRRERPEDLPRLEARAGHHFEQQGAVEAALPHYLRAADHESAARVLSAFAREYVERGRLETLNRYLSALPAEVLSARPGLLMCRGDVLRRLGQASAAVVSYEAAREVYEGRQDMTGLSHVLVRLAEVYRAQGNYERARQLAVASLEHTPQDDHGLRAEALMALAKSTGFLSGMDQGRQLAEEAVAEARRAGANLSPLTHARLLQSLGQICWWHGDPQATVAYCQEALRFATDEHSPIVARAHITMATPYLYWRDLDTALRCAERGLEIAQQLHMTELLPSAYTVLGNVLTRRGETARAESVLRQAVELAQRLGLAAYEQIMAAGYLAYNLYGQGRVEEARQVAEGALWAYPGSAHTYEAYVCRSVLADVALERGDLDLAHDLFEELVEVGRRRQFRIPLAMVYFGLAYIDLVRGDRQQGLENARRSLALIEPSQAIQLYLDQGERARVVTKCLLEAGERSPFLRRVAEHLAAGTQSIRVTASDTAIDVFCLGPFRVVVNGEEVRQKRWVSTKARDLLAFFITQRGERVPADRALDAVWPDAAGPGRTAFHTALTRLRKALRAPGQRTQFVLVEGGEYWLDTARFRVDVDAFDNALAKARAAVAEAERIHWYREAISLYRGDYLDNLYYDWVLPERRRLAREYLDALQALADHHLANHEYAQARDLLARGLEADPYREDLHCLMLRCHAGLRDRAGLVRHYRRMRELLGEELGVEPSPRTQELYQALLAGLSG